jgi:hypothetical protein
MRIASLLAAAGLVTAGLVASAPAANAAGSCSLYIPSRLAIGHPYRAVTANQGPNCVTAAVVDAAWAAYHPTQGVVNVVIYENRDRSEIVDLYATMPPGRWTWRPGYAYDANDAEVFQYTTYTDVRMASYGRATATRSGSKVNVRTTAMRYWGAGEKFIGWAGARGQIQYRTPGTSTWKGLKEVYSYSNGTYSYTYSTTASREYRVVLRDVPTIWGSTSPAVRR